MELSDILSKLNWRLLLVHMAACWFFIYAFRLFFIMHDLAIIDVFVHNQHAIKNLDPKRITNDAMWVAVGQVAGLLVGYLISLLVSIKYQWSRLNSLIVFLVAYFLWRFSLFGWEHLALIFLAPGSFFKDDTAWYYIINGAVMLAIGLFLFFSKWAVQFIEAGQNEIDEDNDDEDVVVEEEE